MSSDLKTMVTGGSFDITAAVAWREKDARPLSDISQAILAAQQNGWQPVQATMHPATVALIACTNEAKERRRILTKVTEPDEMMGALELARLIGLGIILKGATALGVIEITNQPCDGRSLVINLRGM